MNKLTLNANAGHLQPIRPQIRAAMIDSHALTRDCIITATSTLDSGISFVSFNTIRDCVSSADRDFDVVLYYPHDKTPVERLTSQEITTLRQAYAERPIILLSDATQSAQSSLVRDALRAGAKGVISTRTIEMATVSAAIRYVMAGGIVVPVDVILANSSPPPDTYFELPRQIELTGRQMTVLGYLRQGKANKIIAHELHMSESTVKVHVRNIMRKMGATNRTQAVYNARQLHEAAAAKAMANDKNGASFAEGARL
jgi:DNA-binding NarL/FixJ family response regulator